MQEEGIHLQCNGFWHKRLHGWGEEEKGYLERILIICVIGI
jgi:hypothetical protein